MELVEIKIIKMKKQKLYYVRSKYCHTIVDDTKRTKEEAEIFADNLNEEAIQFGSEVVFEIIPVG